MNLSKKRAYTEHRKTMDLVRHLGGQVCDATGAGEYQKARKLRLRIHRLLSAEQRERPEQTANILRVKAPWCSRASEELRLLERSFSYAKADQNSFQMAFSAVALAEYHASRQRQQHIAAKWLLLAKRLSATVRDRDLKRAIKRLTAALEKRPE